MSLDGLRAWIGEVERKLGMRTKAMLALAAIAIGGAGTAVYLAIDTREKAVSEGDVQELQTQLESQIQAGGGGAEAAALQAEIDTLRAEVEALQRKRGGGGQGSGSGGNGAAPGGGASGVTPALPPGAESLAPDLQK